MPVGFNLLSPTDFSPLSPLPSPDLPQSLLVAETVPHPAHGLNVLSRAGLFHFRAKPPDVHVHGARPHEGLALPNRVEDLVPGKHPTPPLHQEPEQPELRGREQDGLSAG